MKNRQDCHYFARFHARRSLRIWPIYFLTLIPVVAGYLFFPTTYSINALVIAQYFTYTQNIQKIWFDTADHSIRAFGHTWTLAIEEQYYILWPFLVRALTRGGLVLLCLVIMAGSVALRAIGMSCDVLPARCDGFTLGALLAVLGVGQYPSTLSRHACLRMLVASASIAAQFMVFPPRGPPPSNTTLGEGAFPRWDNWAIGPINVFFFGLIGMVILNAGHRWLGLLRCRALVYLGTISYGLYLYHLPVMFAIDALFRKLYGHGFGLSRPLLLAMIELTVSIMVAAVSWRLIEKPILGLKTRFGYGADPDAVMAPSRRGQGTCTPVPALGATSISAW
jgi:peptidoglycan/LPS O-acetylase OafA/YrhL